MDREVADALSLDAEHLVGLSAGDANEGALAHAAEPPPAGYHDTAGRQLGVAVAALVVGLIAVGIAAVVGIAVDSVAVALGAGVASGAVLAGIVLTLARR